MRSILRIATASMTRSTTHVDVVSDDLSTWEVLSDTLSDDDVCSFYGDETMSIQIDDVILDNSESMLIQVDDVIVDNSESEIEKEEELEESACVSRDDVTIVLPLFVPPPVFYDAVADDDDVEEEDELYDDDLEEDEELVACYFKNRFGKQRVKKMGKTGGPKPKLGKSKKLPYHSNNTGYAYL